MSALDAGPYAPVVHPLPILSVGAKDAAEHQIRIQVTRVVEYGAPEMRIMLDQ